MHSKTILKQQSYVQESSERVAALDQRLLAQLAQLQGTIGLQTGTGTEHWHSFRSAKWH